MTLRVSLGKRSEKTQNKTSWISPNQDRLRQEGLCRYFGRGGGERGKLWKIRRPSLALQNLTWGQKAKSWARLLHLLGGGGESCLRSVGKAEEGNTESRLHTFLRIHLEGVWKKGFLHWEVTHTGWGEALGQGKWTLSHTPWPSWWRPSKDQASRHSGLLREKSAAFSYSLQTLGEEK